MNEALSDAGCSPMHVIVVSRRQRGAGCKAARGPSGRENEHHSDIEDFAGPRRPV